MKTSGYGVPVLMYHSVSDRASPRFSPFAVTPMEFRAQMQRLSNLGFTTFGVSQLQKFYKQSKTLPLKSVVLTFDDGYLDFAQQALPVLVQFNFTATVYIVAGCVGRTSCWLKDKDEAARPLMSWDELRDVEAKNIEIGAHSWSHKALDTLDATALKKEIVEPKRLIEANLSRRVDSFAYPFGFSNKQIARAVSDAGYTTGCAVKYRLSTMQGDPFDIPRYVIRRGIAIELFERITAGSAPFTTFAWDRLRSKSLSVTKALVRGLQ